MVNFETVESAREFFYQDKFAVNTGITLDIYLMSTKTLMAE